MKLNGHLQPNKTFDCQFTGGLCRIPEGKGGLIRATASGTVMVNYLYDHDDRYLPLTLVANDDWSPNNIKAIRQQGTTVPADDLIIGLEV